MSINNFDYGEDTSFAYGEFEKPAPREKKLRKQRYPRGRRKTVKALPQQVQEIRRQKNIEEAKRQISKVLFNFDNFKESGQKMQKEIYIRWIKDSLNAGFPIIDPGDIRIATAISSVGAGGQNLQKNKTSVRLTHLPTRISVRNEETRSLEQNRLNAQNHLQLKLNAHLSHWQVLTQELPSVFSASEINRKGISVLELLK